MEQEIATQIVGLGGASDFSLWQLFLRADFVVKAVIVLLLVSSIYSWALIFDKYRMFKKINESSQKFEDKFWKSKSAEGFSKTLTTKSEDPMTQIFQSAMNEVVRTRSKTSAVQSARVERVLEISIDNQIKNFTFLATVGATAPFIGLFGTVWGIMNSFQSIAISRNTSLAIVAPGIAEALFATALGLLAAIPAVVAYNKFNSDSKRYVARIDNFSKRFLSII
jgi:biopolymer transport protein TolQ